MFNSSERTNASEIKKRLVITGATLALAAVALAGCSKAGAETKPHDSAKPTTTSSAEATQSPAPTEKVTIAYAPNKDPSLKVTLPLAKGGEAPLAETTIASLPETLADNPQQLAETWMNAEQTYLNSSTGVDQQSLQTWIAENDPMNSAQGGADEPKFDDQYFTDADAAIFNKEFTFPGATDGGNKPLAQDYLDMLSSTHDEVIGTARKSMYVVNGNDATRSKTPVYKVNVANVQGKADPDPTNVEVQNLNTDKQVAIEITYTQQDNGEFGNSTGPTTWKAGTTKTIDLDFADKDGKLYLINEQDR